MNWIDWILIGSVLTAIAFSIADLRNSKPLCHDDDEDEPWGDIPHIERGER